MSDGVVMILDLTGESYARGRVRSQRVTTSSRYPGRKFEGVVHVEAGELALCPDCGHKRMAGPEPHSPHWRGDNLVDCVGRVLRSRQR